MTVQVETVKWIDSGPNQSGAKQRSGKVMCWICQLWRLLVRSVNSFQVRVRCCDRPGLTHQLQAGAARPVRRI